MYLYVGVYHDFVMDDLSIKFLRIHICVWAFLWVLLQGAILGWCYCDFLL